MTWPAADRLPFVIGVTGHRDLHRADLPRLRHEVHAIIRRLKCDHLGARDAAATTDTPIIILSDLAEGADQLVAEVALGLGARLIVPLPMPVDLYRRDFAESDDPRALATFEELLARAIATPVVPFTPGNSPAAVQSNPERRREQYRAARTFIARHCHVLIALWDGEDNEALGGRNAVGGVADIVNFRRHGVPLSVSPSVRASLDSPEGGTVVHVMTPRLKPGSPPRRIDTVLWGNAFVDKHRGGRFRRRWRGWEAKFRAMLKRPAPHEDMRACEAWESFAALVALTAQYNTEAAALALPSGASATSGNLAQLFIDREKAAYPDAQRQAERSSPRWCAVYAAAETLAQQWQRTFRSDWFKLFVWALVALACFETFSHLAPLLEEWIARHTESSQQSVMPAPAGTEIHAAATPTQSGKGKSTLEEVMWIVDLVLLSGYVGAFVRVFWLYLAARKRQDQERFLDYRALAEALRVAIFWRLAGIARGAPWFGTPAKLSPAAAPGAIVSAADVYPLKQPSELAWVKTSLRALELLASAGPVDAPDPALMDPGCAWVGKLWVDGQRDYFERRRQSYSELAERREGWASLALVGSVVFAFALVVCKIAFDEWIHHEWHHDLMIFIIGLLPGVAAAFLGYSEKIAFKAQSRQYDRMYGLFDRAWTLLAEKPVGATAAVAQPLFVELGLEALHETAEWVAIYRQRPIQPP